MSCLNKKNLLATDKYKIAEMKNKNLLNIWLKLCKKNKINSLYLLDYELKSQCLKEFWFRFTLASLRQENKLKLGRMLWWLPWKRLIATHFQWQMDGNERGRELQMRECLWENDDPRRSCAYSDQSRSPVTLARLAAVWDTLFLLLKH